MPQHSKGERDHVTVRTPVELGVKKIAKDAGYEFTSQYIADFLAIAHGHPELVVGPKNKAKVSEALPGMPSERELRAITEFLARERSSATEQEVTTAA